MRVIVFLSAMSLTWTAAPAVAGAAALESEPAGPSFQTSDGALCEGPLAIRVTVNRIKKGRGHIVADLHDDVPENFLKSDKVIHRVRHPAKKGAVSFCIPVQNAGEYAIGIYHDKNSNEKFDKGFLRIPKERFGASGNPDFGLSAPDYRDCAIAVGESGADITIRLVSSREVLG